MMISHSESWVKQQIIAEHLIDSAGEAATLGLATPGFQELVAHFEVIFSCTPAATASRHRLLYHPVHRALCLPPTPCCCCTFPHKIAADSRTRGGHCREITPSKLGRPSKTASAHPVGPLGDLLSPSDIPALQE